MAKIFQAPLGSSLSIAIVGAGIGGLACAVGCSLRGFTDITIYEAAPEIAEVGAGIQVAPNFARLLEAFGVLDHLKKSAVQLNRNSIRRYDDDFELGRTSFAALEKDYGHPTIVVHRGDLHASLLKKALELGVVLKTGSWISEVDFDNGIVKVANGGEHQHDLIVGADGIKSPIRRALLQRRGEADEIVETGEAAYRVILNRAVMENDIDLKTLISEPVAIRWIGPDAHIVAYPIKNHQAYNIVTTHMTGRDDIPEDWTNKASKSQMIERFKAYSPVVRKLFALAPSDDIIEWVLRSHKPMSTWIDGKVALLGDSCHPSLPHLAQGAAMAGEDGAVLATLLATLQRKEDIPKALKRYEDLRKPRADWAVETARLTGEALHLPDGAAQQARDEAIKLASAGKAPNPDKWGDLETQKRLFGTDVVKEATQMTARL